MAPAETIELPDVMTAGCDEGVEFVFLEEREETPDSGLPDAGIAGAGAGVLR